MNEIQLLVIIFIFIIVGYAFCKNYPIQHSKYESFYLIFGAFIIYSTVKYLDNSGQKHLEKFKPQELNIAVGANDNYKKHYIIEIGDNMIFKNLSPYVQNITGDIIGLIQLKPGSTYVATYNQPGIFSFSINNNSKRYVHVEPPHYEYGLLNDYNDFDPKLDELN